ncbi:uncharacterized protein BYT42DRAFT_499011 [Radiomyces spectabilis]|uniref:uncharacterized protein n=1 Tax=Radiomyces spectabilis TaxID=64574 RepID=UPI00221EBD64|nr:uncharacterized protein BYT42DRAFT_499011 [Radiomyces spectabilis]KAI8375932.1 hypothetical protein BYT42DRAFT_499011 [Radiomyces spectabilis]
MGTPLSNTTTTDHRASSLGLSPLDGLTLTETKTHNSVAPNGNIVERSATPPSSSDEDNELEKALDSWNHEAETQATLDLPPTAQIEHITKLENKRMVEGETWYCVAKRWYSKWKQYCSRLNSASQQTRALGAQAPPGPVDNSTILDQGILLPDLVVDDDLILLPEEAWNLICHWYGVSSAAIPRRVIKEGEYAKRTIVELYPPTYYLHFIRTATSAPPALSTHHCPQITLSRTATVADLKSKILQVFELQPDSEIRLWILDDSITTDNPPFLVISFISSTWEKLNLDNNQTTLSALSLTAKNLAVELKDTSADAFPTDHMQTQDPPAADVTPINGKHETTATTNPPSFTPSYTPNTSNKTQGVCGLTNLGNSCYMNSALQCLSNTPQLSQWFLSDRYKKEVNRENPLGMNGEIAEAYGALMEKLWNGTTASLAPRDFKYTISRFNPTFSGYQQHDSQELLAFLLDGLHEDLNRILKKPYVELPDFDTMPDNEIAQRSWDYHKARNDSIIVDLFQGQFKSRLVCNECGKVSVTFDPFMYLSLPLPIRKKRIMSVVYVPYDPQQKHEQITLSLPKDATIMHLRKQVADMVQIDDPSTLLVVELFSDKIYKVFSIQEAISTIGRSDTVYIYQLPVPIPTIVSRWKPSIASTSQADESKGSRNIVFPVYNAAVSGSKSKQRSPNQFGGPMLLCISEEEACRSENLYRLIAYHLQRYAIDKLADDRYIDHEAAEVQIDDDPTGYEHKDDTVVMDHEFVPKPDLFNMMAFSRRTTYGTMDDLLPTNISAWNRTELRSIRHREAKYMSEASSLNEKPSASEAKNDSSHLNPIGSADDQTVDSGSQPDHNSISLTQPKTSSPHMKSLLRQGEGLLVEWQIDTARDYFGMAKQTFSLHDDDESGVDGGAWREYIERKNPKAEENPSAKKVVTLSDCLDEFMKEEQLGQEDLWYCPRCRQHQRASKKFDLWRLPEIMVVHLKRFSHSRTWRDKIDAYIDFPLDGLDLTERVLSISNPEDVADEDRLIYDLFAVDNHYGGMGGGHCK